ncbi:OTU protein, partial [Exophiala xenobiotica]
PYQNVRYAAAEFMAANSDDFAAFMEEPLESYVQKIRDTAEWGGQLELQAISRAYTIDINVLQADGRVEKISCGTEKAADTRDVWLAYYRHSFGLGEHYNALKKVDKS